MIKYAHFSATAIWNSKISNETACRLSKYVSNTFCVIADTHSLLRHTQVLHTSQEKRNHHHLKNDALLSKVNVVSDTTMLQQHSMTTRLGSSAATGQFLSPNFEAVSQLVLQDLLLSFLEKWPPLVSNSMLLKYKKWQNEVHSLLFQTDI